MKVPFLSSIFTKDKKSLRLPDSLLIKKLKVLSQEQNFSIFDNITIYHHAQTYHFPLILLDEARGLYIFEKKEWAYDDLKNAKVEKAQQQNTSKDTLSFEKKQDIIHQKLNELTHHSDIPIYNYLLMENLNASEYEHLDISFQELIPANKVIFSDTPQCDILEKLHKSNASTSAHYSQDSILGNLLIQYALLDEDKNSKLCTQNQRDIINHTIFGLESLQAPARSGKTNTLLLKAIFHLLTHKNSQVLIIKPTLLSCDLLKQKLVSIIEHAIIDFDILNILIVTPYQFLDIKKSDIPKLILCDDANLLKNDFVLQLIAMQKNANLLLVNYRIATYTHTLKETFSFQETLVKFHHVNKLAKALLLIGRYSKNAQADEIVIISNEQTQKKLMDDLHSFIEEKTMAMQVSEHLMLQTRNTILFLDTLKIDELNPKHLIILDITQKQGAYLEQSIQKTSKSVDIIYETPEDFITQLKEKYESN